MQSRNGGTVGIPMGYAPMNSNALGFSRRDGAFVRVHPSSSPAYFFNSKGLPLRSGRKTCAYYEKTGRCKYGAECHWNHPEEVHQRILNQNQNCKLNSKGYPLRDKQDDCKYYLENGVCSFGVTCRWNHPEGVIVEQNLNSLGLPLRPEAKECEFYLRTGSCKFGNTCKFHHPEPSVTEDGADGKTDGKAKITLNERGHPLRPGLEQCSYYVKTGRCDFGATCRFDHPNGIELKEATRPKAPPPEAYTPKGYPVRSNTEICDFYAKSGECKFGSTCRFHHPPQMATLAAGRFGVFGPSFSKRACYHFSRYGECKFGESCRFAHIQTLLNSKGYPIRPGQPTCAFYEKTGECKYGQECRWNHPDRDTQFQLQGAVQGYRYYAGVQAAGQPARYVGAATASPPDPRSLQNRDRISSTPVAPGAVLGRSVQQNTPRAPPAQVMGARQPQAMGSRKLQAPAAQALGSRQPGSTAVNNIGVRGLTASTAGVPYSTPAAAGWAQTQNQFFAQHAAAVERVQARR